MSDETPTGLNPVDLTEETAAQVHADLARASQETAVGQTSGETGDDAVARAAREWPRPLSSRLPWARQVAETEPNQTESDQTEPDQTEPDQIQPGHIGPDESVDQGEIGLPDAFDDQPRDDWVGAAAGDQPESQAGSDGVADDAWADVPAVIPVEGLGDGPTEGPGEPPLATVADEVGPDPELAAEPAEPIDQLEVEPTQSAPPAARPQIIPEADDPLDLTELPPGPIAPVAPAPSWPTASASPGQALAEPVPGIVEVDTPVTLPENTIIMPPDNPMSDQRAARARALGEVDPGADVVAAPARFEPPSVYKSWPSFTLFLFRLLVAGVMAIRATEAMVRFSDAKAAWAGSIIGQPTLMATLEIVVGYVVALMLLLGLGTRVAGFAIMVVYITILSFLVWGVGNPFSPFSNGFRGEFELVMIGIGLVFAGIGGGGAAVDAAIHRGRLEKKNIAQIGESASE